MREELSLPWRIARVVFTTDSVSTDSGSRNACSICWARLGNRVFRELANALERLVDSGPRTLIFGMASPKGRRMGITRVYFGERGASARFLERERSDSSTVLVHNLDLLVG